MLPDRPHRTRLIRVEARTPRPCRRARWDDRFARGRITAFGSWLHPTALKMTHIFSAANVAARKWGGDGARDASGGPSALKAIWHAVVPAQAGTHIPEDGGYGSPLSRGRQYMSC